MTAGIADDGEQRRVQAADWFARLHSPTRSDTDLERFNQWLAAHPDNQATYARMVSRWEALGPVAASARERRRTTRRIAGAAAGSLVLMLAGAFSWWLAQPEYATPVGEQRRVALADGSAVVLDTDTAVDVDLDPEARQLALRHGRARFLVAADAKRPFVVEAGEVRITALGTAFDVRREGEQVDVVLIHGRVRIDRALQASATLVPAQRAISEPRRAIAVTPADLPAVTAWSEGRLVYAAMPLRQVLAELGRYVEVPLDIDDIDPDIKVSGVFETSDPRAALRTLAAFYRLDITEAEGRIRISSIEG